MVQVTTIRTVFFRKAYENFQHLITLDPFKQLLAESGVAAADDSELASYQ